MLVCRSRFRYSEGRPPPGPVDDTPESCAVGREVQAGRGSLFPTRPEVEEEHGLGRGATLSNGKIYASFSDHEICRRLDRIEDASLPVADFLVNYVFPLNDRYEKPCEEIL